MSVFDAFFLHSTCNARSECAEKPMFFGESTFVIGQPFPDPSLMKSISVRDEVIS